MGLDMDVSSATSKRGNLETIGRKHFCLYQSPQYNNIQMKAEHSLKIPKG